MGPDGSAINQNLHNMKRNALLRTSAIFKCIVTFKNGTHAIIRMTIDMVAKITYEFREFQRNIFSETWLLWVSATEILNITEIQSCKFINESTGVELLTIE
jgi:hypothetical protein